MTQTPVAPASDPGTRPAPGASRPRLGWLDALRGLAALVVVYHHLSSHVLDRPAELFHGRVALGRYGVLVFFIVSGYVIPVSLARYGSLRRFWTGRVFRIYPAWLLAVAAASALIAAGVRGVPGALREEPVAGVLAHVTMLQHLLGLPDLVSVFWTLSFEMVFYLLVSALFVLGLHRRYAWWAVGLAVVALLGGRVLPADLLSEGRPGAALTTFAVAALLAGSVAAYVWGRRRAAVVAAVAGLGILALPLVNGAPGRSYVAGSWQAAGFLALMFAGAVVHAGQHGRLSRRATAATLVAVGACLCAATWLYTPRPGMSAAVADAARTEAVGALLAAFATFAAGFALRHRAFPRWLTWTGTVSYSVYLLHPMLLTLLGRATPGADRRPFAVQALIGLGFLAAVLIVAWLSYRAVERPGQALGRRVEQALDARLGPDLSAPGGGVAGRLPSARRGVRAFVPRRRGRVADRDVTQHADMG